jgi:hypothetical protein
VFHSVFGMIVTDAYLGYMHEWKIPNPGVATDVKFFEFVDVLASQLIRNDRENEAYDLRPATAVAHASYQHVSDCMTYF